MLCNKKSLQIINKQKESEAKTRQQQLMNSLPFEIKNHILKYAPSIVTIVSFTTCTKLNYSYYSQFDANIIYTNNNDAAAEPPAIPTAAAATAVTVTEFWREIASLHSLYGALVLVPRAHRINMFKQLKYSNEKRKQFLDRLSKDGSMKYYFAQSSQENSKHEILAKISVHGTKGSGKTTLMRQLTVREAV